MSSTTEDIEFKLLVQAILERFGYDFHGYAEAALRRRFDAVLTKTGLKTFSILQNAIMNKEDFFAGILSDLTVTTSEMFRDPAFYKVFREQVVPVLRTYSAFRIWHAGCSRGEEIYSLAILLEEEGLYDRAVIYATDINPAALEAAKGGIYPATEVRRFTANYLEAGGRESFSSYYTASYGSARFDPRLRRNVLFMPHNLVTDDVFSEIHVVMCRNVLIYFERALQARVLNLFSRSLCYKGYLCLGSKETVRFIEGGVDYEEVGASSRIFRKIARGSTDDGLMP